MNTPSTPASPSSSTPTSGNHHAHIPPTTINSTALPAILAGPIVRDVHHQNLTLWLVTSVKARFRIEVIQEAEAEHERAVIREGDIDEPEHHSVQVGKHCFIHLLNIALPHALKNGARISYDLFLNDEPTPLKDRLEGWVYDDQPRANFVYKKQLDHVLHGSCRKPHYAGEDSISSEDALLHADGVLAQSQKDANAAPALLLFSGDQIYADDVAGPMLKAVHEVADALGLFEEDFDGAVVSNEKALRESHECYYKRVELLPDVKANEAVIKRFFGGVKKPIFTSVGAHNHLITFSEFIAMYLLVWSPECWRLTKVEEGTDCVNPEHQQKYQEELPVILEFAKGLTQVRRILGHVPVYMIFDDHDVTDDWNLTRGWEEAAYNHPFSRRIIGNAMLTYWLCQGWGNSPKTFDSLYKSKCDYFTDAGLDEQDELINTLYDWNQWHYTLDTQPAIVVLDTRTHRWRSESSPSQPSGLMDWEALSDMQQTLLKYDQVIMVSPSPIFGVKVIESVQKIFTFFGQALAVDAENWMAHPGAASVMLNIFNHPKTPRQFVILSGDVHYHFASNITLRQQANSPQILQVCASGLKNCFPSGLLSWFDRINRWLYSTHSPLNFFTKRRDMRIHHRHPNTLGDPNNPKKRKMRFDLRARELYNASGLGQLFIAKDISKSDARVLNHEGVTEFVDHDKKRK